jgi:hypothetical protein
MSVERTMLMIVSILLIVVSVIAVVDQPRYTYICTPFQVATADTCKASGSVYGSGDRLIVTGRLAGLGSEPQVHVVLTATIRCGNRGDRQAEIKQVTIAEGDFPVQNGDAGFRLRGTADPVCSPPMRPRIVNALVAGSTHGISMVPELLDTSLPG